MLPKTPREDIEPDFSYPQNSFSVLPQQIITNLMAPKNRNLFSFRGQSLKSRHLLGWEPCKDSKEECFLDASSFRWLQASLGCGYITLSSASIFTWPFFFAFSSYKSTFHWI
jgi:hypothetical protein